MPGIDLYSEPLGGGYQTVVSIQQYILHSLAGICFLCTGFAVLLSKYSFSDLWLGSRRRKRKWKISMTTRWLLPSITTVKGTNISEGKVCICYSLCFFITMSLLFYDPTLGFLCLFWTYSCKYNCTFILLLESFYVLCFNLTLLL